MNIIGGDYFCNLLSASLEEITKCLFSIGQREEDLALLYIDKHDCGRTGHNSKRPIVWRHATASLIHGWFNVTHLAS